MNIDGMLRKAEALETQLGLLYEWLSTVLVESPAACGAFFRLSMEERSHANLVAYQRRMLSRDLLGAGDQGLFDTLATRIDCLLHVIADFRAASPRPTVAEAVRMAISLETSAVETVHRDAVAVACPELASLVSQLGADDRRHLQNLHDLVVEQDRAAKGDHATEWEMPAISVRRNRPTFQTSPAHSPHYPVAVAPHGG